MGTEIAAKMISKFMQFSVFKKVFHDAEKFVRMTSIARYINPTESPQSHLIQKLQNREALVLSSHVLYEGTWTREKKA